MAKIQELYDRTTGEAIYPRTSTQAVYDAEGRDLETRLAGEAAKTDEKLGQYTKTDALNTALAAKQNALTVSADLELTPAGALSVEERAKREVFDDTLRAAGVTVANPGALYALNGLDDITFEEMVVIFNWGQNYCTVRNDMNINMRTNLLTAADGVLNMPWGPFWGLSALEVVRVSSDKANQYTSPHIMDMANSYAAFSGCRNLRKILGSMRFAGSKPQKLFADCVKLEEFRLWGLCGSISFATLSKISIASLQHLVAYAANTTAITVTVHPDVFAKLTGDTTNEAAAALTEEELTQWSAVLTDALEKNITFATV